MDATADCIGWLCMVLCPVGLMGGVKLLASVLWQIQLNIILQDDQVRTALACCRYVWDLPLMMRAWLHGRFRGVMGWWDPSA